MYAPLHTKSHYSLGDGCTPVDALVDRAAGLGYPVLGLTDVLITSCMRSLSVHCSC